MFDVMLRELATRFGLGEKARDLLGALLALIFDPGNGGFEGFVARLRAAGLGAVVDSWLGRGENNRITAAGVVSAFGPALLDQLAAKAGMNRDRTVSALTALLPGVLDKLTPDAMRPAVGVVPPAAAPYLGTAADFAARTRGLWPQQQLERTVELTQPPAAAQPAPVAWTAVPGAVRSPAHAAAPHDSSDDQHGPSRDGGMGGRWIAWAALLLVAIAVYAWLRHVGGERALPLLPVDRVEETVAAPPVTAQNMLPGLRVGFLNGAFRIEGTLGQAAEREQVVLAATRATGSPPAGSIQVDTSLPAAGWGAALVDVLPQLAVEGLEMELQGPVIDLLAVPPASDPAGLAQLAARFPGQQLTGWFDPSVRAFAALTGETVEVAALAQALNTMDLHFAAGGHTLRADSRRVLRRAAAALKRAPQDTLIEVGGHTGERGSAQENLSLSEARAFAVVEALNEDGVPHLRVQGRGYGDSVPAPAGSQRRSRIEFTVLRPASPAAQP